MLSYVCYFPAGSARQLWAELLRLRFDEGFLGAKDCVSRSVVAVPEQRSLRFRNHQLVQQFCRQWLKKFVAAFHMFVTWIFKVSAVMGCSSVFQECPTVSGRLLWSLFLCQMNLFLCGCDSWRGRNPKDVNVDMDCTGNFCIMNSATQLYRSRCIQVHTKSCSVCICMLSSNYSKSRLVLRSYAHNCMHRAFFTLNCRV